jgi:hypothetical protein
VFAGLWRFGWPLKDPERKKKMINCLAHGCGREFLPQLFVLKNQWFYQDVDRMTILCFLKVNAYVIVLTTNAP